MLFGSGLGKVELLQRCEDEFWGPEKRGTSGNRFSDHSSILRPRYHRHRDSAFHGAFPMDVRFTNTLNVLTACTACIVDTYEGIPQ